MALTAKQTEYLRESTHRWNIKTGATGSGKSWLDYSVLIPRRLLDMQDGGAAVLLGNTQGTASRNILDPMRAIWGGELVGTIGADNSARLFGRKVYVMGADNRKHVARLQGLTIEYAYGDEITTWAEPVFQMFKSRLRCPHSVFDGTCNPDSPTHWLRKFIDSGADVFNQTSTIYDNPHLPRAFVEALEKEYAGTVYFDRFILGRWVAAEGAIYRVFCDNPQRFIIGGAPDDIAMTWIGVDFGGNGSAHAFELLGTDRQFKTLYVLDEYYRREIITPQELERDFVAFIQRAQKWPIMGVYADSAEQVLIKGINLALLKAGLPYEARNAKKGAINERIRFYNRLFGADRIRICSRCAHTIEALQTAVWQGEKRLDDGTTNIDSLDAMEYATERVMGSFL